MEGNLFWAKQSQTLKNIKLLYLFQLQTNQARTQAEIQQTWQFGKQTQLVSKEFKAFGVSCLLLQLTPTAERFLGIPIGQFQETLQPNKFHMEQLLELFQPQHLTLKLVTTLHLINSTTQNLAATKLIQTKQLKLL